MDPELAASGRVYEKGEAFVTARDDLRNARTSDDLSEQATITKTKDGVELRKDVNIVIEIEAPDGQVIATPVNAKLRGYGNTGTGRTAGGIREYVIQNETLAQMEAKGYRVARVYELDNQGVRTPWERVARDGKMSWEPSRAAETKTELSPSNRTSSMSSSVVKETRLGNGAPNRTLSSSSNAPNADNFGDGRNMSVEGRGIGKSPSRTPGSDSPTSRVEGYEIGERMPNGELAGVGPGTPANLAANFDGPRVVEPPADALTNVDRMVENAGRERPVEPLDARVRKVVDDGVDGVTGESGPFTLSYTGRPSRGIEALGGWEAGKEPLWLMDHGGVSAELLEKFLPPGSEKLSKGGFDYTFQFGRDGAEWGVGVRAARDSYGDLDWTVRLGRTDAQGTKFLTRQGFWSEKPEELPLRAPMTTDAKFIPMLSQSGQAAAGAPLMIFGLTGLAAWTGQFIGGETPTTTAPVVPQPAGLPGAGVQGIPATLPPGAIPAAESRTSSDARTRAYDVTPAEGGPKAAPVLPTTTDNQWTLTATKPGEADTVRRDVAEASAAREKPGAFTRAVQTVGAAVVGAMRAVYVGLAKVVEGAAWVGKTVVEKTASMAAELFRDGTAFVRGPVRDVVLGVLSIPFGGKILREVLNHFFVSNDEKLKALSAPGKKEMRFFETDQAPVPGKPASAVFDIRHNLTTTPLLNVMPHFSRIKMAKDENPDDLDVGFNEAPAAFIAELKSAKSLNVFVHGFNVGANQSLKMRELFADILFPQGHYFNVSASLTWSGDAGNNFVSKPLFFKRAEQVADMTWPGVARMADFAHGVNPDVVINPTTHSLGARLVLDAAENGVKFGTVILIVPAVENNALCPGGKFEKALQNIDRLVVIYSRHQEAVFGTAYRAADFGNALGYTGPTGAINHPNVQVIDGTDFIKSHSDIYNEEVVRIVLDNLRRYQ